MVDEADKLLDQTFSQWLPKLMVAIATDKNEQNVIRGQRSLENTLIDLCGDVDRLRLLQLMDSRLQCKVCVCVCVCVGVCARCEYTCAWREKVSNCNI